MLRSVFCRHPFLRTTGLNCCSLLVVMFKHCITYFTLRRVYRAVHVTKGTVYGCVRICCHRDHCVRLHFPSLVGGGVRLCIKNMLTVCGCHKIPWPFPLVCFPIHDSNKTGEYQQHALGLSLTAFAVGSEMHPKRFVMCRPLLGGACFGLPFSITYSNLILSSHLLGAYADVLASTLWTTMLAFFLVWFV